MFPVTETVMIKVGTRYNPGYREASFLKHFRQGAALCLLAQDWLRQAQGKRRTEFGGLCKPCHLLTSVLLILALVGGCKSSGGGSSGGSSGETSSLPKAPVDPDLPKAPVAPDLPKAPVAPDTSTALASSVISELQSSLTTTSSTRSSRSGFRSRTDSDRRSGRTLSNSLTSAQITLVVDAATSAVSTAGLDSSEDLIQLMPKIIEGAQAKLASVGLSDSAETIKVINVIVNSLVTSLNGRSDYLPGSSAETGATATETVLKGITAASVANLDEAGLSSTDIGTASSELVGTMVGSLGSSGITASEIGGALDRITAGAVDSLDKISGFDATSLGGAIDNITGGATAALGDISVTGFSSDNLAAMVEKVTAGATSALGSISMTGYSSDNLSSMVEKVTSGATAALGKITMPGYSSDNLASMVEKVTSGATGALGKITMTGYDSTKLSAMVKKVTAGATGALGSISMTGYDADDLGGMVEKITSGATKSLGDITMTGYDADDLGSMVKEITSGTTGALDEITMSGYGSDNLTVMVQKIASGTTGALDKITMSGYDANDVGGLLTKVTLGGTEALEDLEFTGFDASSSTTLVSAMQQSASKAIDGLVMIGITEIADSLKAKLDKESNTLLQVRFAPDIVRMAHLWLDPETLLWIVEVSDNGPFRHLRGEWSFSGNDAVMLDNATVRTALAAKRGLLSKRITGYVPGAGGLLHLRIHDLRDNLTTPASAPLTVVLDTVVTSPPVVEEGTDDFDVVYGTDPVHVRLHHDPPGPYRTGADIRFLAAFNVPPPAAPQLRIGGADNRSATPMQPTDDPQVFVLEHTLTGTGDGPAVVYLHDPDSGEEFTIVSGHNYTVDNTGPGAFISLSPSRPSNTYQAGETLKIIAAFLEPLPADPPLMLTLAGQDNATAVPMTRISTTTYTHTLTVDNGTGERTATFAGALDLAGNAVQASPLGGGTFWIDGTPPSVSRIGSPDDNGSYGIDAQLSITLEFSEAVEVTGMPRLRLNTTPSAWAYFAYGSGSSSLTFLYTVKAGTTSAALDLADNASLDLNDGTLKDFAGIAAELLLPEPGTAGSLSANAALKTDTLRPTVTQLTPPSGRVRVVRNTSLSASFSEAMRPESVSVATSVGGTACAGTFQLSADDFLNCPQMQSDPTHSADFRNFTITPAFPLAADTAYVFQVAGVEDETGNAMDGTTATGFHTRRADGLVAAWALDSNANDASSSNYHGSAPDVVWVADRFQAAGRAAELGKVGVLRFTNADLSGSPEAFTVSWWMRTDFDFPEEFSAVLSADPDGIPNRTLRVLVTAKGNLRISTDNVTKFGGDSGLVGVVSDGWQHFALTYDNHTAEANGTTRIYHNGELRHEATGIAQPPAWNGLGVSVLESPYPGTVDDLRVYDESLSAAQVQTVFLESELDTFRVAAGKTRFLISAQERPELTLKRGGRYRFDLSAPELAEHEFFLSTETGGGSSAGEYTSGVVGGGAGSAALSFAVPLDAPDTLYYECATHADMGGVLHLKD